MFLTGEGNAFFVIYFQMQYRQCYSTTEVWCCPCHPVNHSYNSKSSLINLYMKSGELWSLYYHLYFGNHFLPYKMELMYVFFIY